MIKVAEAFDHEQGSRSRAVPLISVLQRHYEGIDSACPDPEPSQFASLAQVLERIPDPRRVRGRRYRLDSLLALCLVAVLGGAASLAAISRFPSMPTPVCANDSDLTPAHRTPPRWDDCPAWTATPWTTPWALGSPGTPPTRSTNSATGWSAWPSTARPCEDPAPTAARPPAGCRAALLPDRDRPAPGRHEEQRNPRFRPAVGPDRPARRRRHRRRDAHPARPRRARHHGWRPLPPGRQREPEEAASATAAPALAGNPSPGPHHWGGARPPRGPSPEGLHRPAGPALPPRRPGHGDQTPPHPPQDQQGRDEDRLRGY